MRIAWATASTAMFVAGLAVAAAAPAGADAAITAKGKKEPAKRFASTVWTELRADSFTFKANDDPLKTHYFNLPETCTNVIRLSAAVVPPPAVFTYYDAYIDLEQRSPGGPVFRPNPAAYITKYAPTDTDADDSRRFRALWGGRYAIDGPGWSIAPGAARSDRWQASYSIVARCLPGTRRP